MATSTKNRSPCKICNKPSSIFFCRGCQNDFCTIHAKEHRQQLSQQLDSIILQHDQLKQNLSECMEKPSSHPLIKQIEQWETESINKIRRAADDARKQLSNTTNDHTKNIIDELKDITKELTAARSEDNFIEIDLKDWIDKLQKLTNELNKPSSINIRLEESNVPFIQKVIVDKKQNEFFEQSIGQIKIEENGQVIRTELNDHSTARCHCEYSSGQHKHRFKIEQFHTNKWIFFGIVSKNTTLQKTSCQTPTTFGWTTNGYAWINGNGRLRYNGYTSDAQENDILELILDCDRRMIYLRNERTNNKHGIEVDINLCRFPWQIHVGLQCEKDRVRYLSS